MKLRTVAAAQRSETGRISHFIERADFVILAPNPAPSPALLPFLEIGGFGGLTEEGKEQNNSDRERAFHALHSAPIC